MISQRDSKGRFLPGNKAREGKTGKSYAQILREVLDETASRTIIKKAVEQAANGDAEARRWLFSHVMPRLHVIEYSEKTETPEVVPSTGNPFDDFNNALVTPEYARMLEAMTYEEMKEYEALMDRLKARHDEKPHLSRTFPEPQPDYSSRSSSAGPSVS